MKKEELENPSIQNIPRKLLGKTKLIAILDDTSFITKEKKRCK